MRLARPKTPVFSTSESPFEIGVAYILREGYDVSLFGTGSMTCQLLLAAKILEARGISAEVVHVPTVKPLDEQLLLNSARRTGRVVAAEEAQISCGFGGAIAELLSEYLPTPLLRIGIEDRFGESGEPDELLEYFGLNAQKLVDKIELFIKHKPQYHREY